ncbi:MAG: dihydroneopterin aldolase [Gammaproteobacteria bacterium]|nr:dihydroneopterin aldolase [Gammaproteobacteria bacterium]MCH9744330.1 dihydroneopterin aldolase [Gammaproteobacteria bacterium]
MTDRISIQQLKHPVHIGLTDDERQTPQQLIFDLSFAVDAHPAAINDDIECTVNYAAVCQAIVQYCDQTDFKLIETLADKLAEYLIKEFHLQQLRLTINKKPFDLPNIENVSIHIERA